tara:strand:+ start:101 stop:1681 length:1581 start_codon:yes stop_codon:yes gene_type:complete
MIKKSILAVVESKYVFYSLLLFNIVLLCFTKFYPSMDGAAHLYNSKILLELVKGNPILSEFYTINKLPIPNWTGHFILLLFQSVLPAWIAEKILLILYVAGMAVSFRYLIKVLNPENTSLSILIFPFIYSFLFHLGFYNFSISFIFFFTSLGFWLQNNTSTKPYFFITLFLLFILTYFTNLLIFGFLGITIGFYILYFSYKEYINNKDFQISIKFALKKLGLLLLVSLPGLIFLLIFFANNQFFPSNQSYSIKELLKWINDVRPFIVYDYPDEKIITEQYFHVLLIMLAFSFIRSVNQSASKKLLIEKVNIIAIPLILTILLLFITPNGTGAGMMSDRYCLMLFIFGLILIVSRPSRIKINTIVILIFVVLHIGLLFKHLNGTIKKLDKAAIAINNTEKYISENDIVLPINLSDNWLEPHFSNYLGINKPVIILENYEASVGWFPVKWNSETMPKILLTDKESICGIHWPSNAKSSKNKQIDFVLLYGNQEKFNDSKWQELRDILSTNFKVKYNSSDNYVLLYERL